MDNDYEEIDLVDEFVEIKAETDNDSRDSDLEIIEDPLGEVGFTSGSSEYTSRSSPSISASSPPGPEEPEPPMAAEAEQRYTTRSTTRVTKDLPACWTRTQYNNFKLVNKWLLVKEGKIGCQVCSTSGVKMMEDDPKCLAFDRNVRPPQDWITCKVQCTGRTSMTRQASLRKKIHEHKKSKFHLKALDFEEAVEQANLQEHLIGFKEQLEKHSSIAVFTSAYETVKLKLPFSTFQTVCSLPGLEDLFVDGLTPEKVFTSILGHVASKLRESMIARLMCDHKKRISIVMHETGILNNKAMLAIHLKFHIICGREIFDSCVFFDLLPLVSSSADEVVVSLINCLKKNKINMDYLRKNLVAFIFDEMSPVLGRDSGVPETLTRQIIWFPNVNIKYDFNHKLYDDVKILYQSIASGVILPSSMFTTTAMADAMFISVAGRPAENFNAAEMANSWLTNESSEELWKNLPQISSGSDMPEPSNWKISNDMALAAEAHDEQRLVIDLQSEPESNSNSYQEAADNAAQQSPTTSRSIHIAPQQIFEIGANSESSLGNNNGVPDVKRRKRNSCQANTKQNSNSDSDVVEKGQEPSDLCTCKQDKDRLFLLSLLPFMKQLNSRENLEFRMEVQQLLHKKFNTN